VTLVRRDRILVLAWSLPDALRSLESRSSETRRLSPAVWQLCLPCDGTGATHDRWGKAALCPVCRGAGRYRSDPYADGDPVSGLDDSIPSRVLSRPVTCDRCDGDGVIPGRYVAEPGIVACPSCEGTGKLHLPFEQTVDLRVGSELDRLSWSFRGGDWDALDSSLEAMRSNGRRTLWRAFVGAYVEPPYAETWDSTNALEHVEASMPHRVRVPAEIVTAYRARAERARLAGASRALRMGRDHRNREIRAALKLGHSTEEVARQFALSERTVQRISS